MLYFPIVVSSKMLTPGWYGKGLEIHLIKLNLSMTILSNNLMTFHQGA